MTGPDWTLETLKELIDERFLALEKALVLQADEYQRRLDALNHAHEKAIDVQHTYVTQDRYEQYVTTAQEKVELALQRVNEKFEDYVKRYEQRQREVDQALSLMKAAGEQATQIAEAEGRKTRQTQEEATRRSNRNIAVAGLLLAALIAIANYLSTH